MLLGRGPEIAALRGVVDRARSGGSATLVVRGEPGVGKTALLEELDTLADDFRLVRTEGIESELQLDYAALHRIVLPFLDRISQLPAPQRDAMEAAFGLTTKGRPDQFLVGLATLTLLGDPERTMPLLIVVDDAHWLDEESITALAFVGRRLEADGVALVFAVRDLFADKGPTKGLPELRIEGLADDCARDLLASLTSATIVDGVATKIVDATGGNPLALSGLAKELTESQLAGLSPLPDPLPTGQLIESRFAHQVLLLPRETQIALLLAAAEPTRDLAAIDRAAGELGSSLSALEPAEKLQLVTTEGAIEFRHPLIRSAVYSSASAALRRKAHQALATALGATDTERSAMHRALAAIGPDEEVAAALEESAALARRRGGYTAETALLSRSAELSPGRRDRSRRLLGAAHAANLAGNSAHAQVLLDVARHGELDELDQARAQLLEGMISVALGRGRRAPAVLLEAAKSLAPLDPELSRRAFLAALSALFVVSQFAEGTTGREIGKMALNALDGVSGSSNLGLLLRGVASAFVCDYSTAAPALRGSLAAFEQMTAEEITEWHYVGAPMANALWDPDAFGVVVELLESAARRQGSILALQTALLSWSAQDIREGKFSAARRRHIELLEITEAVGGFTSYLALHDVGLLAWEGEEDAARAKMQELIEIGTALGSGAGMIYGHYAIAVLELGLGRYSDALNAALAAEAAGTPFFSCFALPLIVEAAMRCGDVTTATEAMEQIEEKAQVVQTPFALGLMWRSRALVLDGDQTESSFRSAIELFEKSPWRTELAHTYLLYGEWLRRRKRRTDARVELQKAHDLFESMGAKAFAGRARLELEATGGRGREARLQSTSDLTVRERQISVLAGDGLTNSEIGSQLFISPRTVEYHLNKVFHKLGVKSRIQLAKAIAEHLENRG